MGAEIVHHDNVAATKLWDFNQATNRSLFAVSNWLVRTPYPVRRIAPSSVRFVPQSIGTRSINSSPRFTQAWLRLMEVFMPDSSRNTSRSKGTRRILLRNAVRFAATSGRRLSSGRRRFFLRRSRVGEARAWCSTRELGASELVGDSTRPSTLPPSRL